MDHCIYFAAIKLSP